MLEQDLVSFISKIAGRKFRPNAAQRLLISQMWGGQVMTHSEMADGKNMDVPFWEQKNMHALYENIHNGWKDVVRIYQYDPGSEYFHLVWEAKK